MSASAFTVWDVRTGTIIRTGSCPTEHCELQAIYEFERAEAGHHDYATEWHDGEAWRERSTMVLEANGSVVRGLPIPAKAMIEGVTYDVDDGEVELSFQFPGTYTVSFMADGFKDASVTIQWPVTPTQGPLNPA